jgi:hypothetical protein
VPHTQVGWIAYTIFGMLGLFTAWRGRRWERISGFVLLAYTETVVLVQDRVHWMDPGGRLFTTDTILLLYFLALAISFGRIWMIFAAAFQLLVTLSHPAAHFARQVGPTAYLTIVQAFTYGVYLTAAIGAVLAPRTSPAGVDAVRQGRLRSDLGAES